MVWSAAYPHSHRCPTEAGCAEEAESGRRLHSPSVSPVSPFKHRFAEVDPEEKKQERLNKFFDTEVVSVPCFAFRIGEHQKESRVQAQRKRRDMGGCHISCSGNGAASFTAR